MKKTEGWQSPNFRNGVFQNLSPTELMSKDTSYLTLLKKFVTKPKSVYPPKALPSVHTDLKSLTGSCLVWFGHSSYLIHHEGLNILVDPVFSGHASPFSFMIKAFAGSNVYTAADMPDIDILIITHNHYDHLDSATIRQLAPRVKSVYTTLGVGQHLISYGISPAVIREMDWWEEQAVPQGTLTATPARHFSGRGLKRGGSLWASFVLQLGGMKIFVGGDSGYDTHFSEIGKRFGPLQLAILETGQYNRDWPDIHMQPENAVRAAQDLHADALMPVHWGKFALAYHPWNEPPALTVAAATKAGLPVVVPRIGEVVVLGEARDWGYWWENF